MIEIKFNLKPDALLTRGTSFSAGIDLHAYEYAMIHPMQSCLIDVGVTWEVNLPVFGMIKDRSSLAIRGLRVGAGIIDSDYRGDIKVLLMNHAFTAFEVIVGMPIAQFLILNYVSVPVEIRISERGTGGFGSTDVK